MSENDFGKAVIVSGAITILWVLYMGAIIGCRKAPMDPPAPAIEGEWRNLISGTPNWIYSFEEGILIQTALVGDIPVSTNQFTYAVRADTIHIGGAGSTPARQWKYKFHLDSLLEIRDITPGLHLSKVSWLIKR